MMWQQLKETTMEPGKRSLYKLATKSNKEALTSTSMAVITTFVNDLMGRNPSKRTAFIKSGAASYHQQS